MRLVVGVPYLVISSIIPLMLLYGTLSASIRTASFNSLVLFDIFEALVFKDTNFMVSTLPSPDRNEKPLVAQPNILLVLAERLKEAPLRPSPKSHARRRL